MTVNDIDPIAPQPWSSHFQELRERGSFTFESLHQTKDGEIYPVEVTVNYVNYGGQEYSCAFVRDISERKKAEQAALESERRYRGLVENAHDLIFTLDGEGCFINTNPAVEKATGYAKEELLGRPLSELARDMTTRADSGSDTNTRELRLTSKNGVEIILEARVRTVLKGGQTTGSEYIARDVTEENLWEEALKFQAFHDAITSLPNRAHFHARPGAHVRARPRPLCPLPP